MDHTKQSATISLKISSERSNQKTAEATGDFICNKIADKITSTTFQINWDGASQTDKNKQKYQKKDIYHQKTVANYW